MLALISSETIINQEVEILEELFVAGIEILQLRKPNLGKEQYEAFLKKMPHDHKRKIVLHQFHELATRYNVGGLHLKESDRQKVGMQELKELQSQVKKKAMTFSSSFHSMEEIEKYDGVFDYVFLSPVFASISKPGYGPGSTYHVSRLKLKKTKVIALGGVDAHNIAEAKKLGFDGIALLGALWQDPQNASHKFQQIKKEYEAQFLNSNIPSI